MSQGSHDPEIEALIDVTLEIGNLLDRYIDIHNRTFKVSLRHLIPIPGIFKAIDFQQHFESLSFIKMDIEGVLQSIARSPWASTAFAQTVLEYGTALRDTVIQLREMCGKLFQKADGTLTYSKAEYNRDFAEYKRRIENYRVLGQRLNAWTRGNRQ